MAGNLLATFTSLECSHAHHGTWIEFSKPCPVTLCSDFARLGAALPVLLALLTVVMPGCGGCRKSDEAAEKKKKEDVAKQKKKKPVDVSDLETLPSDDTDTRNFVKPGHMVTAWVGARANLEDLRAEFETSVANGSGRPIFIGNTRYHLVTSRPAVLPKGQQKYLETTYFIPVETEKNASSVFLQHKLKSVSGGGIVDEASQIAQLLPNYQYLLAVLSANPNAFGYLKQMEAVKPSYDELRDDLTPTVYYRVVLPPIREQAPLPSHPLAWTMLAYVLWDGMQPGGMTPSQQTAMIDWLHWGGQLIVSGPGSLDQLAGSFLDPYLPAVAGRTVELGSAAFEELNQTWALTRRKTNERLSLKVQETSPIVGVRLQPRPGAELLAGTGSLVVERRVGRGRVVVTSFPLTHPDVVNWGSFDSFLNACIFRRPSRRFTAAQYGAVRVKWASSNMGVNNPLFLTATRYFTRDVGRYADAAAKDPAAPRKIGMRMVANRVSYRGSAAGMIRAVRRASRIKRCRTRPGFPFPRRVLCWACWPFTWWCWCRSIGACFACLGTSSGRGLRRP